jgi:hypothetical protein
MTRTPLKSVMPGLLMNANTVLALLTHKFSHPCSAWFHVAFNSSFGLACSSDLATLRHRFQFSDRFHAIDPVFGV